MPEESNMKVYLRKVRLNKGGYDEFGSYWGATLYPLYQYEIEELELLDYIRAKSREAAKTELKRKFPKATFFN
jgi:hypothetical protein